MPHMGAVSLHHFRPYGRRCRVIVMLLCMVLGAPGRQLFCCVDLPSPPCKLTHSHDTHCHLFLQSAADTPSGGIFPNGAIFLLYQNIAIPSRKCPFQMSSAPHCAYCRTPAPICPTSRLSNVNCADLSGCAQASVHFCSARSTQKCCRGRAPQSSFSLYNWCFPWGHPETRLLFGSCCLCIHNIMATKG